VTSQVGGTGGCTHDPPHALAGPNGDTPLPNGNVLVSETSGSWIDELSRSGTVVWSVQLPIAYPSDPQPLGGGRYLVADYARPGGIYEFDRKGRILWSYHPASGAGMLDHPSLAARLPNGLIAANDDYRDRVVVIDPRTRRIVWQYGRTDRPGFGADRVNTPTVSISSRPARAPLCTRRPGDHRAEDPVRVVASRGARHRGRRARVSARRTGALGRSGSPWCCS
jgi:hypothetical protein